MTKKTYKSKTEITFAGIPPDVKPVPVFKSAAEYNAWTEKFSSDVSPVLKKQALARLKALQKAANHMVD